MEGKGSLYHFVDGDTYIGQFSAGQTHGNIIKLSSLGYKIQGRYERGHLVHGTFLDEKLGVEYTGDFKEDKFHGKGTLKRVDKNLTTVYEGEFYKGMKNGSGTIT